MSMAGETDRLEMGASFGVRAVPRVFLADQPLKVFSFSESTIVAELPESVPYGSYELRVQTFFRPRARPRAS
jgi:hypothetical protein